MEIKLKLLFTTRFRQLMAFIMFFISFSTAMANVNDRDETSMIDMPKLSPIILKFSAFDPAKVPHNEFQIVREIVEIISKSTTFPLKSIKDGPRVDSFGLRVVFNSNKNEIQFQYVKVRNVRETNAVDMGQVINIPVTYKVEQDKDIMVVTLTPGDRAILQDKIRFVTNFFIPSEITTNLKVGPADRYITDFEKILSTASSVKLQRHAAIKGEAVSNFKSEAILGNFERLLGRNANGYLNQSKLDLNRGEVFSYLVGNERVPLIVSVYPYRDGSKVTYETSLPYQIGADGSSDGFDNPQKLKADVEKVLND